MGFKLIAAFLSERMDECQVWNEGETEIVSIFKSDSPTVRSEIENSE